MAGGPHTRILVYLACALALTATVWGLARWSVETEAEHRLDASARAAERLALFFEEQTLSIFRYGDSYLKMVRREYARNLDLDAARAVMKDVPLDSTIVSHVTILDATGEPIFNSGYDIKPGTNAGDRDYFTYQRDRADPADDTLFVSLPLRGRNSGQLLVRLVRRVQGPDGRFAGVIFAALDAAGITEFFEAMNLGEKSSATLIGLDKRIRARSPYGRNGPGQDVSGSRLWRELEQHPRGLYRQTSVVDGITRYYAYRRLEEFPLVVTIGVAVDDISKAVSGYRFPVQLVASLATVLIVTVTALLWREVLTSERVRASESAVRAMHDRLEERVAERTTELESVQEELRRADRLAVLGRLTGTVAHELRNPLSTIATSLSVLEKRLDTSPEEVRRPVERIHRNVDRCNNIIAELLDFARVHGVSPRPTALDAWMAELLGEISLPDAVTLRFEPGAGDIVLPLDRDRMQRAISNLVDNARDAIVAADGGIGSIRIRTGVEEGRACIEVADDGPGIPADVIDRVHDPLFSTKSFGIGLGLSIVEQTMEAHGGGFELSSREGEGTLARLTLPVDMD